MKLIFLILLLEDCTNGKGRGVAIDNKLLIKLGLVQDGGGTDSVNKGSEHYFMFIIPIKLPFTHVVSYKHIERCGQDAKSVDIHLIEI